MITEIIAFMLLFFLSGMYIGYFTIGKSCKTFNITLPEWANYLLGLFR
jgi:hypothetical protein